MTWPKSQASARRDLMVLFRSRSIPEFTTRSSGLDHQLSRAWPEKTIILDGFSKTYAMTGWLLGYGRDAFVIAGLSTN